MSEESFEDVWKEKYSEPEVEVAAETSVEAAPGPEAAPEKERLEAAPEPEATPEPAPQEKPEPQDDYRKELERLRAVEQKHKSEEGRYVRELRARQELEAKVKALEEHNARTSNPPLDLDETEQGEVEDFRKKHPDIAKATVDGPRGSVWQKLLLERGDDEIIAVYDAARSEATGAREQVMGEFHRRDAESHLAQIEKEHPDWVELTVNPNPQHEQDVYRPEFVQWVQMLPNQVAVGVIDALKGGTAKQVNTVIQAYKEYRKGPQSPGGTEQKQAPPRAPQNSAAAKAAMAVPSRGTPPPKASAAGNNASFEDLWRAKYSKG